MVFDIRLVKILAKKVEKTFVLHLGTIFLHVQIKKMPTDARICCNYISIFVLLRYQF